MPDEGLISEKPEIPHPLVEQLFQGVAVIQNNTLVDASPGLSELTGFAFTELCGPSYEEFLP
jgi:hypothetical protein